MSGSPKVTLPACSRRTILDLHRSGKSFAEIARTSGVAYQTVRRICVERDTHDYGRCVQRGPTMEEAARFLERWRRTREQAIGQVQPVPDTRALLERMGPKLDALHTRFCGNNESTTAADSVQHSTGGGHVKLG